MSVTLRIILIIGSFIAFVLCIKKIKQSKLKVESSVTWFLGSILLVLMSIFSNAVAWISEKLGFISPVNFVFLIIIAFLLIQTFIDNIRITELNEKIKNLNHYIALSENKNTKK
ncbi:MAG: DUF2304 domain-containing protein [Clostridia bacterium]|jgi:hypothetical protein|nr:DUF2304 domain-containing protein [Clostridia bacterium]